MPLALDDTDSREGMCTTYLALRIIGESGLDLIGFPRLVRLNPTIPFKTRGNGAVVLRLGRGRGRSYVVGEYRGRPIRAYERGVEAEPAELLELAKAFVGEMAEPGSSPGVVASPRLPPESLYWAGVREFLPRERVLEVLGGIGALWWGERGVVGAAAAMAWRARRFTFEALVYGDRSSLPDRARLLETAKEIEELFPQTFDNYDPSGEPLIAPRASTPVLMGVRSVDWRILPCAVAHAGLEAEGWVICKTNQGTDDHLRRMRISQLGRYSNAVVEGVVVSEPRVIEGGHVICSVSDGTGIVDIAAYEPTGSFREVVRALRPGDEVVAMGSVRMEPRPTINLEKLIVRRVEVGIVKASNPRCPVCGRRMEGAGGGWLRCRRDGIWMPSRAAIWRPERRELAVGAYEVDPRARRHLSAPLKITPLRPFRGGPP